MNDDRSLLEAAALAAGISDAEWRDMAGWGEARYGFDFAMWSQSLHDERGSGYWNPLVDDGDVLRLAVKLGIAIHPECHGGMVSAMYRVNYEGRQAIEDGNADIGAAVRRAVVRAAAAMAPNFDEVFVENAEWRA